MEINKIKAAGVHDAPAYAQALKVKGAGTLIFTSGQVALTEEGELCHVGDFKAQTGAVLDAVKRLVEAGGSSVDRIVKMTVFLADARYRPEFGPIRDAFFGGKVPPLTVVEAGGLMRPEWLIEIDAIAVA